MIFCMFDFIVDGLFMVLGFPAKLTVSEHRVTHKIYTIIL